MREYELSNFGRRHNAAQDTLVAKMDTVFMFFTNFPCKKERRNNKKYLRINNQWIPWDANLTISKHPTEIYETTKINT